METRDGRLWFDAADLDVTLRNLADYFAEERRKHREPGVVDQCSGAIAALAMLRDELRVRIERAAQRDVRPAPDGPGAAH